MSVRIAEHFRRNPEQPLVVTSICYFKIRIHISVKSRILDVLKWCFVTLMQK